MTNLSLRTTFHVAPPSIANHTINRENLSVWDGANTAHNVANANMLSSSSQQITRTITSKKPDYQMRNFMKFNWSSEKPHVNWIYFELW